MSIEGASLVTRILWQCCDVVTACAFRSRAQKTYLVTRGLEYCALERGGVQVSVLLRAGIANNTCFQSSAPSRHARALTTVCCVRASCGVNIFFAGGWCLCAQRPRTERILTDVMLPWSTCAVACLFGLLRNHKVHLFIYLSCCAHCARKVARSIAVAVRVFSLVCLGPKGLQVSLSRCS